MLKSFLIFSKASIVILGYVLKSSSRVCKGLNAFSVLLRYRIVASVNLRKRL